MLRLLLGRGALLRHLPLDGTEHLKPRVTRLPGPPIRRATGSFDEATREAASPRRGTTREQTLHPSARTIQPAPLRLCRKPGVCAHPSGRKPTPFRRDHTRFISRTHGCPKVVISRGKSAKGVGGGRSGITRIPSRRADFACCPHSFIADLHPGERAQSGSSRRDGDSHGDRIRFG
jgi:hypothetical protein